jgi:hypothetical protein
MRGTRDERQPAACCASAAPRPPSSSRQSLVAGVDVGPGHALGVLGLLALRRRRARGRGQPSGRVSGLRAACSPGARDAGPGGSCTPALMGGSRRALVQGRRGACMRAPPTAPGACLEDVRVELLLQALVGQVDAELLEGVGVEALEAVNVEDGDAAGRARAAAAAAARAGCGAVRATPGARQPSPTRVPQPTPRGGPLADASSMPEPPAPPRAGPSPAAPARPATPAPAPPAGADLPVTSPPRASRTAGAQRCAAQRVGTSASGRA